MVEAAKSLNSVSFLTPYWSGREMMRIHLASIRQFHPAAPILVSKRGGDDGEMEAHRQEFGVRYWLEDCEYMDAHLRLLERCDTQYACILDHDAVLLSGIAPLMARLGEGRFDLVGVEERIRLPEPPDLWPGSNGWLRFAPGCVASNFILFDWQAFKKRWGLRGVLGRRPAGSRDFEFDYGIGQKLARHHYLLPFHSRRYGIGNLLKDGDAPVLWHQWYGAYRTRLSADETRSVYAAVEAGERAFIADYPALDFSDLAPARGTDAEVRAEQLALSDPKPAAAAESISRMLQRLHRWWGYGARGLTARALARLDRWWRLR